MKLRGRPFDSWGGGGGGAAAMFFLVKKKIVPQILENKWFVQLLVGKK